MKILASFGGGLPFLGWSWTLLGGLCRSEWTKASLSNKVATGHRWLNLDRNQLKINT